MRFRILLGISLSLNVGVCGVSRSNNFFFFCIYKSNIGFFFLIILRLKKRVLWLKGDDSRRITKVRSEVKMFFIFSHRNDFFYSCDVAFSFRDEIFYLVLVECLVRQSNRDESTLMRIEVFCEGGG